MKAAKAPAVSIGRVAGPSVDAGPNVRPTTRRTLRALGGRRVMIEGFGRRSPTFIAIAAGDASPVGAWLSPIELRRFIETARRILK